MTRRPAAGCPQGDLRAEREAEAAATSAVIAGLRRRLKRQGIEHPSVQRELGKLEELLFVLFEQAGSPGRHRSQAGHDVRDTDPAALKPDPVTVETAADYISVLLRYRTWSGEPSWRQMAANARVSHSAMHKAMHRQEMPKLEVVEAIIIGCGGQEDLPAFALTWQRINCAVPSGHLEPRYLMPAPVQAL